MRLKMADLADELWRDSFIAEQSPFMPEAVESYGRSSYSEEYKVKGGVVERDSSKDGRFVAENVRRALKVLAGADQWGYELHVADYTLNSCVEF